ncbi:MAG: hypothetical protein KDE51_08140 [Anaerolineales bacterium]|nr:hypothetical protein [Anaerolineales bacterium]
MQNLALLGGFDHLAKEPLYSQEKALGCTMAVSSSGARRCTREKVGERPSEGEERRPFIWWL